MKCPYCGADNTRVIESRPGEDGTTIRRRRECIHEACGRRFTTYERVEQRPLMVVKKDQKREEFSRDKLYRGIMKACEKRPIPAETLEAVCDEIERKLRLEYEREVPSSVIGERVMDALRELDGVAYVRFASVYREFRDVETLLKEVLALIGDRARAAERPAQADKPSGDGTSFARG
ncbi:transcriptional regulator NrdR [Alicyclobacillus acidocaldarius]|uniref:Transcriptional repressor NrdR n=1 Tax=Alicyclobacillus acidocaldarius (strain Tc-4-1) TaxID=1048834 RepID=F8IE57_ALIAT|nr:transcriptional regulator NrdR [Alicyclobacillus acidocaldarius]AEJ43899.1 ATP-cone domain protein [Alicyclobacillus acidocaldarius subsp. acidocaldarius Tc-4-1]